MIYLIISIFLSSTIFVVFKLFDRFGISNQQAIVSNYIVASFFGYNLSQRGFDITYILQSEWLITAIIMGFLYIAVFNLFALSSQKAGVAITAVASKMSVIIPVIFGVLMFQESLGLYKAIGIVFALIAFYLSFKKKGKLVKSMIFIILPLLLFIGNGANDTLLKVAEHFYLTDDQEIFVSTIFFTALLIGLIILPPQFIAGKERFHAKSWLAGIFLGLLNFLTTYFALLALNYMESTVMWPFMNAGIVTITALTGFLVFREKLSRINWIGIILAVGSIFIIAFS